MAVDALRPPLTGIGRYAYELASRMDAMAGIDEFRCFDAGHWVKDRGALLQQARCAFAPAGAAPKPGRSSPWPRWVRRHLAPAYWRHALKGRVFHGPNYFLPVAADKGIVTVHDLSIVLYPQMHPLERLRQFDQHFERSVRKARHLITDSEAIRRDVIAHFGCRPETVTAVPLGVSEHYRPMDPAATRAVLQRHGLRHGRYALCVSTLEPRKNIDKLVVAYGRLPERSRAEYPLVLVGASGWENDHLHEQIARASAAGWLRHPGFLAEEDLPALYAGARLFAFPSIYEGFGLPLLEAMASGVPVLTSNRSSLPEVAGDAGLLIDPDDPDALLAGLRRGLDDEAWSERARTLGPSRAAEFTWQRCAERTAAIYRRVDLH